MRKIMFGVLMALFVGGIAFASVNVLDNGTNKGPAQDINFVGATVTDNGPAKTVSVSTPDINGGTIDGATIGASSASTGAFTSLTATSAEIDGAVVIDGSIYTATLAVDGAIYAGSTTLDPCATLGVNGWIFFNNSGEMCYCKSGADVKAADGSTACF